MENKKVSKKTLNSLLNDSMREVINNLELPKPTKKVQKVLDRSSKKTSNRFCPDPAEGEQEGEKGKEEAIFCRGRVESQKRKKIQTVETSNGSVGGMTSLEKSAFSRTP